MRYYLFFLGIAAGCWGATITLTATCTDGTTVATATQARCDGTVTDAIANTTESPAGAPLGIYKVFAQASYLFPGTPTFYRGSAIAQIDGDFVLTLHGGTGTAEIRPCFAATGFDDGVSGVGEGIVSFTLGSASRGIDVFGGNSVNECNGGPGRLLAQFETPLSFHLTLKARAIGESDFARNAGGTGYAALLGFTILDAVTGNVIPGASATLVDSLATPEPGSLCLVGVGAAALLYRRYLRRTRRPTA